MAPKSLEDLKTEQRQRKRGRERLSDTGFTRQLEALANAKVDKAEAFIKEAERWRPIEEIAERNTVFEERRRANKGSGEPLRSILDACDD